MPHEAYFSFCVPQPPRGVTQRQREVWRLLALGASYKEIAGTLGIKRDSVKAHVQGLYSRLGVMTQHEVAVLGVAAGLVTQEEQIAIIEHRTCGAVLRARGAVQDRTTKERTMITTASPAGGR